MRKFGLLLVGTLFAAFGVAAQMPAGGSPASAAPLDDAGVRKSVEAYLRNLYAWGPDVLVTIGPFKEAGATGLLETTAEVSMGEQKDSAKIYVSRDGKYLFRGEMADLSKDPLAEMRAKLRTQDAPFTGDPKAPVTLVEFADFECPMCRQLHDVLRTTLPNYPQARLIFKDFPLSNIHPWARTAALAGRCAYNQEPRSFWALYDKIYDNQAVISAENVWNKMMDYAQQVGLDADALKACMSSPEAAKAVDDSIANGKLVEVTSTPTLFVNGRRMVGADQKLVEQYIRYELARKKTQAPSSKR